MSATIITVVVAIIKFLSFDPRDDFMRRAFTEKNIKQNIKDAEAPRYFVSYPRSESYQPRGNRNSAFASLSITISYS